MSMAAAASGPVLTEPYTLFSVDGDKALSICACMSGALLSGTARLLISWYRRNASHLTLSQACTRIHSAC